MGEEEGRRESGRRGRGVRAGTGGPCRCGAQDEFFVDFWCSWLGVHARLSLEQLGAGQSAAA